MNGIEGSLNVWGGRGLTMIMKHYVNVTCNLLSLVGGVIIFRDTPWDRPTVGPHIFLLQPEYSLIIVGTYVFLLMTMMQHWVFHHNGVRQGGLDYWDQILQIMYCLTHGNKIIFKERAHPLALADSIFCIQPFLNEWCVYDIVIYAFISISILFISLSISMVVS